MRQSVFIFHWMIWAARKFAYFFHFENGALFGVHIPRMELNAFARFDSNTLNIWNGNRKKILRQPSNQPSNYDLLQQITSVFVSNEKKFVHFAESLHEVQKLLLQWKWRFCPTNNSIYTESKPRYARLYVFCICVDEENSFNFLVHSKCNRNMYFTVRATKKVKPKGQK